MIKRLTKLQLDLWVMISLTFILVPTYLILISSLSPSNLVSIIIAIVFTAAWVAMGVFLVSLGRKVFVDKPVEIKIIDSHNMKHLLPEYKIR